MTGHELGAVGGILQPGGVAALLVPATMRLLGRANWWAPPPLRRLYARYGIQEEDEQRQPVTGGV